MRDLPVTVWHYYLLLTAVILAPHLSVRFAMALGVTSAVVSLLIQFRII